MKVGLTLLEQFHILINRHYLKAYVFETDTLFVQNPVNALKSTEKEKKLAREWLAYCTINKQNEFFSFSFFFSQCFLVVAACYYFPKLPLILLLVIRDLESTPPLFDLIFFERRVFLLLPLFPAVSIIYIFNYDFHILFIFI